jgi:macrolide transport system ATP-binding/permease protein
MSWWRRLFAGKKMDRELDRELRFHMEQHVTDKMRAGTSEAQARREARIEFGGIAQIAEDCRESRGTLWVSSIAQDTRYALRQLRKSPAFTATAVATLALGIGANTAIFTLIQQIMLRSLPVAKPSQLIRIGDKNDCCYFDSFENPDGDFDLFSYDLYLHLKAIAPEFEQLAAVEAGGNGFSVRVGSAPGKLLRSEYVSGNYFAALGVGAYLGRTLGENDDRISASPALVLSYASWQSDFAADPGIVGSVVHVGTQPFTVAGVAPPGFYGDRLDSFPPEMWVSLATEPLFEGANSSLMQKDTDWLYLLGPVREGTNLTALTAKLSQSMRQWFSTRLEYTGHGQAAEIPKQHVVLTPAGGGIQRLQQQTGTGLRLLMALSSVVLLIACANIANLLLARGAARRSNIAVRMALGAARLRVIRQTLTESVLLSLIGGLAGLVIAYFGSQMILALAFPQSRNMPIHAAPSLPVLGFAFLISLATGVVFGAAPAWASSHAQPAEALRGINRATRDRSSLPQKTLVILQVALSVVLLAGALLMTRSLFHLEHQNLGIVTANSYEAIIDPKGAGYTADRLPALYREIDDRFSALPGMAQVSFARYIPLGGNEWGSCVVQQGHPAPGPNEDCFSDWNRVSRNFLDSIGVPIMRGRGFSDQDVTGSPTVVLVNQAFAKHFFPNQDPIGKHFGMNTPENSGMYEIVGVFANFKMVNPRTDPRPLFFRPQAQQILGLKDPNDAAGEEASLYLRSILFHFARPQQDAEMLVRKTLAEIDPSLTIFHFESYDTEVANNFNQDRLITRLTGIFGVLALILASVGLYGVMSYFVARRTSEIGVRMAMGASPWRVIRMVLRGALAQVLIGVAIGVPIALYAGRYVATLLYQVNDNDPIAFAGAVLVLAACAAVAAFLPARRAAAIDPMQALRTE